MTDKPFNQAADNNKQAIAEKLSPYLKSGGYLLEIGSGTGQHAAYMTGLFPKVTWQTSDRSENHDGIRAWAKECEHANFLAPIELDVNTAAVESQYADFVYTANTLHIMHWHEVEKLFELASSSLKTSGLFFVYGPFNYGGEYTSEGNARFDNWLSDLAPHMAIRDMEAVDALAVNHSLSLKQDYSMPANNRLLVWEKI